MPPLEKRSLLDLIAEAYRQPVARRSKHAGQRMPQSHLHRPKTQRERNSGRKHWRRWAKRQARKDRNMRRVA